MVWRCTHSTRCFPSAMMFHRRQLSAVPSRSTWCHQVARNPTSSIISIIATTFSSSSTVRRQQLTTWRNLVPELTSRLWRSFTVSCIRQTIDCDRHRVRHTVSTLLCYLQRYSCIIRIYRWLIWAGEHSQHRWLITWKLCLCSILHAKIVRRDLCHSETLFTKYDDSNSYNTTQKW